jgi:ATP-dependent DNA helicase RecQ
MQTDIHSLLKQYFGFDAFRPLQEDIIRSVLDGKDTLALLPTGGGKSVCYQIPALAQDGLCLVVSPLIALIKDQVSQLRKRNVSVLSIYSGMTFFEVKKSLENACSGHFKFLFVSPERLQTALFKEWLPAMPISLIAVDEAHCISQWGYDFRPPYLLIADIRKELPGIPVLALTASATPDVQEDICDKLQFRQKQIFRQSFAKPNLSFSAFLTPHKIGKLLSVIKNVPGCGLVYVRNRRKTKEIARLLQLDGIAASFYHAGLSSEERNSRQEDWMTNKTPVMVCTNAFGMGIDKPDVRTVVHMDIPDCIESYYQEAGRAGRDGRKAYAVLLYSEQELEELENLPARKFPSIEVIRSMYEAVCNYLQIPVGAGEGNYYDFNLMECSERFKIDINHLANALGTLSQAGYISFSENVFLPSKVEFTIQKERLYAFEKEQPALEPLIKALLRSYEGIFDNLVNVQEKQLVRLLQKDETLVRQELQQLTTLGVIRYQPKKESPQVFFLYDRVPASQVRIDAMLYEKRKQVYTHKIKSIIGYASKNDGCRSQVIRHYFGERHVEPCGICDVCLQKKAMLMSQQEVERLGNKILEILPAVNSVPLLAQQLHQKETHITAAIEWLAREEKIEWNGEGKFQIKTSPGV